MQQFLSEGELNTVKGLLHYLNENLRRDDKPTEFSITSHVTDSNGEHVASIQWTPACGGYAMVFDLPEAE